MAITYGCDVCDGEIGDHEDMGKSSMLVIQTSSGPLTVVFAYGFGILTNDSFRPNSAAVCKRCVFLNLQAELDEH